MYGMCAGARSVVVEAYAKYGMPGKVADALNSRGYVNRIGKKWRHLPAAFKVSEDETNEP